MAEPNFDIEKAAAVILHNRQVLLARSRGKSVFVSPGGKLEPGETQQQACVRELNEELGINVSEGDLEIIGTFYAEAAGGSGQTLKMGVWMVKKYRGIIGPRSEIEELAYVGSHIPDGMEVGSIFEHHIIPYLKQHDLID